MHAPTTEAKARALRAVGKLIERLADPHGDDDFIIAELQAVLHALGIETLGTRENFCVVARRAWPEQG